MYRQTGDLLLTLHVDTKTGGLTEVQGRAGCLSAKSRHGCTRIRTLGTDSSLLFSRDNRHVYINAGRTLRAFTRDRVNGGLISLPGPSGCASLFAQSGCSLIRGWADLRDGQWGQGGRQLYLAGDTSIVVLDVTRSGGLKPRPPLCFDDPRPSRCGRTAADQTLSLLTFTPDGRHAFVQTYQIDYAISMQYEDTYYGRRLIVLDRNPITGALTYAPGRACVAAEGTKQTRCLKAHDFADDGFGELVTSPNGRTLYDIEDHGLAEFRVGADGTSLSQPTGPAGCVRSIGHGCTRVPGADTVRGLLLSVDGHYAALANDRGLTVSRLDRTTGALVSGAGANACVVFASIPGCRIGRGALTSPSVRLGPDQRTAVLTSSGGWARFRLPGGRWTAATQP